MARLSRILIVSILALSSADGASAETIIQSWDFDVYTNDGVAVGNDSFDTVVSPLFAPLSTVGGAFLSQALATGVFDSQGGSFNIQVDQQAPDIAQNANAFSRGGMLVRTTDDHLAVHLQGTYIYALPGVGTEAYLQLNIIRYDLPGSLTIPIWSNTVNRVSPSSPTTDTLFLDHSMLLPVPPDGSLYSLSYEVGLKLYPDHPATMVPLTGTGSMSITFAEAPEPATALLFVVMAHFLLGRNASTRRSGPRASDLPGRAFTAEIT